MKLNDVKASEIAKIIYNYAVENAVQDILTENDNMGDPRYDIEVPQNTWTSCSNIDFEGLKLKVFADFYCSSKSDEMKNPECQNINVTCVGGTQEQEKLFYAYNAAIEYELRKIAGYYCDVCVE